MQKPSVGRIVHVNAGDGRKFAAIITAVHEEHETAGLVSLTYFLPHGGVCFTAAKQGDGHSEWNWPVYVPVEEEATPVNAPDPDADVPRGTLEPDPFSDIPAGGDSQ